MGFVKKGVQEIANKMKIVRWIIGGRNIKPGGCVCVGETKGLKEC